MSYEVRVTGPAKDDVWRNYRWWGENRSRDQAVRWFLGIDGVIAGLAETAERHPLATEPVLRQLGIRQASFGLGRRPSHRIVYLIDGDIVIVYRVRALKQDQIGPGDLAGE